MAVLRMFPAPSSFENPPRSAFQSSRRKKLPGLLSSSRCTQHDSPEKVSVPRPAERAKATIPSLSLGSSSPFRFDGMTPLMLRCWKNRSCRERRGFNQAVSGAARCRPSDDRMANENLSSSQSTLFLPASTRKLLPFAIQSQAGFTMNCMHSTWTQVRCSE